MERLWQVYGNVQSVRGRIGGLPGWARMLIGIAALPGIVLIALSVLALLVSILALLLLTVPLYRLLGALTGTRSAGRTESTEANVFGFPDGPASPGRKKVDVTIIE